MQPKPKTYEEMFERYGNWILFRQSDFYAERFWEMRSYIIEADVTKTIPMFTFFNSVLETLCRIFWEKDQIDDKLFSPEWKQWLQSMNWQDLIKDAENKR